MGCNVMDTIEDFTAPISVYLNLTRRCNMECIYCYAEVHKPGEIGDCDELTDEEFLSVVDQLMSAKVFRYAITGGEPFIRRELLFTMLERIGRNGHVLLYTNGTYITEDAARRLARTGARIHALLSIDAPIEEVNAITRGKGYLAKTVRGVRRLVEQGISTGINCTLTKINYTLIPQLLEFTRQIGARQLHIIHFQPIGLGAKTSHLVLSRREQQSFSEQIVRLGGLQKDVKIVDDNENWLGFEGAYQKIVARATGARPKTLLPCSASIDQCNITADGWVTPCNYMMSYHCGNVRQQSFLEIWRNSPQLKRMRMLRYTPITEIPECATCQYNLFCRGGCRAVPFSTTGNLLGLDSSCPYYEDQNGRSAPRQLRVLQTNPGGVQC